MDLSRRPAPPPRLSESPSQTAGPYVHIGLTPNLSGIGGVYPADLGLAPLYREGAAGEKITVEGRVLDGEGAPLRDALVEAWQADAHGLHASPMETRGTADPHVIGWGRSACDKTGRYRFQTIKPGPVPAADGRPQAPHITLWIVARGINLGLHTRLYFADEAEANAADPLLARIDPPSRRETLLAQRSGETYTLDIRIQGERETVFFDI